MRSKSNDRCRGSRLRYAAPGLRSPGLGLSSGASEFLSTGTLQRYTASVQLCAGGLHNCKTREHRCKIPAHMCADELHNCKTPAHLCNPPVHNYKIRAHHCKIPAHLCAAAVHNCKVPEHRCNSPVHNRKVPAHKCKIQEHLGKTQFHQAPTARKILTGQELHAGSTTLRDQQNLPRALPALQKRMRRGALSKWEAGGDRHVKSALADPAEQLGRSGAAILSGS